MTDNCKMKMLFLMVNIPSLTLHCSATLHASFGPCIENRERLTDVRIGEAKYPQNFARETLR